MVAATFWNWAVIQYSCHPTQKLLLALQEQTDLVVLEALFAAWLAVEGRQWQVADVARLRGTTQMWIDEVVLPLREARERWKDDRERMLPRHHLLQLELEAERHLAELMWVSTERIRNDDSRARDKAMNSVRELMNSNLLSLSPFANGKFVSEREQLVALLLQST